ncbi:hypothetical protein TCAL_03217 [Tigriopus californicus]|uniref:Cytochrome c oxidase subunit 6B1 n=1 Tax=Tigriopus californicus TaxID=6832 RepID=A0A553NTV3_TIGCA|nr:uncharacterized protein LOC131881345 [Tigriopus californicus]TRY68854.1 hypothetical protein TCAL_03217 [Tigriopus californicus]|eukprot:TCALIF_03217-PA protein Name:"Similar to cox12 Cytochrome c oxidase subunit 6B (Schizosaccharomyces pombe (strain 972 / ATCC 24843))" AED:0.00 eAED:0.00 QI:41/1/1/1/1/1/2/221/105
MSSGVEITRPEGAIPLAQKYSGLSEEEVKKRIIAYNPPADSRFPNQNQTKNCFQNYVDFQRCVRLRGEDYKPCQFFERNYKFLCPTGWIEKWDEQLENNTFPVKL